MQSQPGCTEKVPMTQCTTEKCRDICVQKFGINIFYLACGCAFFDKDTCLCKVPCCK